MTDVPIYNDKGVQVDSLHINDELTYVNGRVLKGDKCYYKGAGVPYRSHNILNEQHHQAINKPILSEQHLMKKGGCQLKQSSHGQMQKGLQEAG